MPPQPPAPPPLASKDVSSHVFSLFSTTFQAPKSTASKTPSQARAAKANEESDFSRFGGSNDGIGHTPGKKEVEDQSTADLRKRMLGKGGKKVVVGDWNRKEKERAAESSDEEEGRSGLGRGKRRRVREEDDLPVGLGGEAPLEDAVGAPVEEVREGDTGEQEGELAGESVTLKEGTPATLGEGKRKRKKNKNKKRKIEEAADS